MNIIRISCIPSSIFNIQQNTANEHKNPKTNKDNTNNRISWTDSGDCHLQHAWHDQSNVHMFLHRQQL